MSNGVAPSCPISFPGVTAGRRSLIPGGDPYAKATRLRDQINSIPRAHDLPSVINALNIMADIITQITHNEPVVNNVFIQGQPSVILKGDDFNPHYQPADWYETGRSYTDQDLINPDDNDQYVTIKTLSQVSYQNPNGASLTFYSRPA